ncbi:MULTISPECIES: DUF1870 family protein [unclassified Streptomyces]|uniref:Aca2/YdiL-like domain-containing protein n=1 Tax=unclassified Streptomyces TaxID=2593676 RepID=UPI0037F5EC0C
MAAGPSGRPPARSGGSGRADDWLGGHLGVSSWTVRHWEQGKYPIPDGARLEIEDLERRTGEFVSGVVEKLMDMPDPGVLTYRDDAEYHTAHPDVPSRPPGTAPSSPASHRKFPG